MVLNGTCARCSCVIGRIDQVLFLVVGDASCKMFELCDRCVASVRILKGADSVRGFVELEEIAGGGGSGAD